jgi:VRR-NUC domain
VAGLPPPLVLTPYDPAEHELQIDCTTMLHTILLPGVCWTAIDHGHSFDKRPARVKPDRHGRVPTIGMLEAIKRKRRGIKSGICDYLFWFEGSSFAIELKVPDGILSDDQKKWLRSMIANKVRCKVCWSKSLVFQTVVEWGLTRRMQVAA